MNGLVIILSVLLGVALGGALSIDAHRGHQVSFAAGADLRDT